FDGVAVGVGVVYPLSGIDRFVDAYGDVRLKAAGRPKTDAEIDTALPSSHGVALTVGAHVESPSLPRVAVDADVVKVVRRLDNRWTAAGVEVGVELEIALPTAVQVPVITELQRHSPVDVLEDRQPV